MNYDLIKNVLDLVEDFEEENKGNKDFEDNVEGFKKWMVKSFQG